MEKPTRYVVDASVGVKCVFTEDGSGDAVELLSKPSARLCVPDLFYAECANVLLKRARRGEITGEAAEEGLDLLTSISLQVTPVLTLCKHALTLALDHDISAYDASYAALADHLDATMVTADGRLAAKLEGSGHDVVLLRDLAD